MKNEPHMYTRRCTRCDELKPLQDFSYYKMKGVNAYGEAYVRPAQRSACKACRAKTDRKRRDRLDAEGTNSKALAKKNRAAKAEWKKFLANAPKYVPED